MNFDYSDTGRICKFANDKERHILTQYRRTHFNKDYCITNYQRNEVALYRFNLNCAAVNLK